MRILLSYSREHFDPARPQGEGTRWAGSANIIARNLHRILSEMGEVTYVDAASPEEVGDGGYDLMVGILRNFREIAERSGAARTVLIAVNVHPSVHNERLLDFVTTQGLPSASLHELDVHDVSRDGAAIDRADAILLFGNVATWNTYVAAGVPRTKIRALNYGSDLRAPEHAGGGGAGIDVLYAVSELGLRKGFDVVDATFRALDLDGLDIRLHIVGQPSYEHYHERLEAFKRDLGDRVIDHGWLPAASPEYRAVVAGCDAIFFPSLEEGQAGTVVDAMACGCVPIPSAASGVDFAPLGFAEPKLDPAPNVEILERLAGLTDAERGRLRARTLEAYEEFHAGFQAPLADAVRWAAAGSPWPRASVILPIHNKEAILQRLLDLLDRPLAHYGNADLQIIIDGCTDRSEEIARRFAEQRTSDYDVTIDVTPDIFEIKTNNMALRRMEAPYGVIIQDDNFVFDTEFLFESMTFLEKDRRAVVLGGLAGVNYYPLGTQLEGPGQIIMGDEFCWRQDADTDPELEHRIFEVDATMRGPLILRKSFLEEHGYLDETFAPLHQDDMDLCFRARDRGFKVYAVLMDVENDSLSMGFLDADKGSRLGPIMSRNIKRFYERWDAAFTTEKDYVWFHRVPPMHELDAGETARRRRHALRRRMLLTRRRWFNRTRALETAVRVANQMGIRRR